MLSSDIKWDPIRFLNLKLMTDDRFIKKKSAARNIVLIIYSNEKP